LRPRNTGLITSSIEQLESNGKMKVKLALWYHEKEKAEHDQAFGEGEVVQLKRKLHERVAKGRRKKKRVAYMASAYALP
jgi:hypothetical protein